MSRVKTAAVPDRSEARVAGLAVLVSLFSFLYYFQKSDLLLYGDAVAHINIARRVFDSQTPGLLQLGTVWLPLPHLLMIPFIWPHAMWQNGSGASIPSMIAYVLGVMGILRLVRGPLEAHLRTKPAAVAGSALRRWDNRGLRRVAVKFLLGIAVVPVLWLAYNAAVYHNALAFANGPYSAKAIEQRVGAPNPALHNAGVAAIYFMKSAQLNMADGNWGRFWLAAAFVALSIAALKLRAHSSPMHLVCVPLLL